MSIEEKQEFFVIAGNEVIKDYPGTEFLIIAMRDQGFRVLLWNGTGRHEIKRGFPLPFNTTVKEFTKILEGSINEIKKERQDKRIAGGI